MKLYSRSVPLLLAFALSMTSSGLPDQTKSPGGQEPVSTEILRTTTTLVEVDVVVRDKLGRALRDLKQDDFEIYDQGKPQRIRLFTVPPKDALPSPGGPAAPPGPAPVLAAPQSSAQTYTNRKPGGLERSGVTVILIDPLDMWCQEWPRNRDGIIEFLRQASPGDRIGIYVMNWNGVSILHDVTQDSVALIKRLGSWNGELGHENHPCAAWELLSGANVGSDFGFLLSGPPAPMGGPAGIRNPNDTNFLSVGDVGLTPNTYATIRKLKSFEAIAHHLAAIPGRKTVIWVSDGFPISGFAGGRTGHAEPYSYGREEEEAMRVMNQANVAIYSFDAGWLRMYWYKGINDPGSPSVPAVPVDVVASDQARPGGQQDSQARFTALLAMREISHDTGGRAYQNTNDMVGALRNAYDDSNAAYTLGFYPEEPRFKGEFHSLRVKVNGRPDLKLFHRKGYVDAPLVGGIKSELEDAAWSPFDARGIGLTASLTNAESRRPVVNINIALDGLSLEQAGNRWRGTIHVALVQKDDQGRQYNSVDQTINLALKPGTYRKLLQNGFSFHESVPMNLETISLRVIVVDEASHNLGSLTIPVTSSERTMRVAKPSRRAAEAGETYVDLSPAKLAKRVHALKGIEPARSQAELPEILDRVGKAVAAFFDEFPNTTCTETANVNAQLATVEALARTSSLLETQTKKFNYLALAESGSDKTLLREYRTDSKGTPVNVNAMRLVMTTGFVGMLVYFHPSFQPDSDFRYVGRQQMDGLNTYVVSFAQIPDRAQRFVTIGGAGQSEKVLLQGVAWVDPVTYEILRMRTDMLKPWGPLNLQWLSTDVEYSQVTFEDGRLALWLPRTVKVAGQTDQYTFHNEQRYSRYLVFNVKAKEQTQSR